jgi:segregation and condensation protein A
MSEGEAREEEIAEAAVAAPPERPSLLIESDEASAVSSYRLTLPTFEGPLDLLLHLLRQHKLDIYDIPIHLVTEQYNQYLDAMTELDLEVAAEYVYMAALLINIKSRMLLPRDEERETEDPRLELVDRLLEYQRFKSMAEQFAEMDVVRMGVWSRSPTLPPGVEASEIDMSEVSLFDLLDAFRSVLGRYKENHPKSIELKRMVHKISEKMAELTAQLAAKSPIRLLWYLEGRDRGELIAIFLATLELVRLGGISLRQGQSFSEILIHKTDKEIDPLQFALYDN